MAAIRKRKGRLRGRPSCHDWRWPHCLVMASSPVFLAVFFDFFGAFFIVSLDMVSPLAAAGGEPALSCAKAAGNPVEATKARAMVAMTNLRMRKSPFLVAGPRTITERGCVRFGRNAQL